MTTVYCENCGDSREVVRARKEVKYCQKCRLSFRRDKANVNKLENRLTKYKGKSIYEYKRICPDCKNKKWVKYIPKPGTKCGSCSSKDLAKIMSNNNKKPNDTLKRYKHTCSNPECGAVRWLRSSPKYRKTSLCGICSRVKTGKSNKGGSKKYTQEEKDMHKKRFFRICPKCEPEVACVEVSSKKNSGAKHCRKHRELPSGSDRKNAAYPKRRKSVTKEISQKAIEKVREINREHKEAVKNQTNKRPDDIPQTKSDEDMIKAWLKNHEPSVMISRDESMPHLNSGYGLGSNTSVMGT